VRPQLGVALGKALLEAGRAAEGEGVLRDLTRQQPYNPDLAFRLGNALREQKKPGEAVVAYREALRLRPDYHQAQVNLGNALSALGKPAKAEVACREALRLWPDLPEAHNNLGVNLHDQGKLAEAVPAFQEALRLRPDYPEAYNNLGATLAAQGKPAEAEVAFRKAIRLRPDQASAHNNLGNVLSAQGKSAEAEAAWREAIRLRPDYPEAHLNLGIGLDDQGKFRQALVSLRKAHALGNRQPRWPASAVLGRIRELERLVELDAELPAFLSGQRKPSGPEEQLELGDLCRHPAKRLYDAAARFATEAFAARSALANDLPAGHRYNAACAAALAGCAQGQDTDKLDAKERSRWRQQAHDWLRADLVAWGQTLDKGNPQVKAAVQQQMRHWQSDPDLAGVRDKDALDKLPEAEQKPWQQFWADVAALLRRASG
jgi:Flp pilus assembly protein TadD